MLPITQPPTYDQLLIELHATLEALVVYSNSEHVTNSALERLAEINKINKSGDSYFVGYSINPRQ